MVECAAGHPRHRVVAVANDPIPALEKLLAEHGPLHEDDIAQRLRDAGVADRDAALQALHVEIDVPARQLVDDRWVWLPGLLAGRVFTHRINALELAHDFLVTVPDLSAIAELCNHERYQRLADGSGALLVVVDYDDELLEQRGIPVEVADASPVLLLAPGTLTALGVAEGDQIGLRLTAENLVLERVTAEAPTAAGAALAATLDADEPEYFDAAVWTACAAEASLFTEPAAPLCEIVADHSLAFRGEWLAPDGFDFDRWDFERGCVRMAEIHGLDDDDAVVLYTLVTLYQRISLLLLISAADTDASSQNALAATRAGALRPELEQAVELAGELGTALADPLLAELLVIETIDTERAGSELLRIFADLLEPEVPPAARVACRWLRAVALERSGDIAGAERELLAAESMDVDWPLVLLDLARIASDRGDAERGLALLHRAGAESDHPLMDLLQRYRSAPRSDIGRNEPCWCGSGRKYKKCHLGREELPLAERAAWLYAKAIQHLLLCGWAELLAETALARSRDNEDAPRDALEAALAEPLVRDAVLFEGGAFAEFVAVRGSLLPDDERALAEQWLQVERSVFEIEQVHPGEGVTLRDLRTGDTHDVRERVASRQLRPTQLLCARVVPAGDTVQGFGGIEPVAPDERDALIELLDAEPDPVELVAQLSLRFAP